MTKLKIYQLKNNNSTARLRFLNYRTLEEMGFKIDMNNYDMVYEDTREGTRAVSDLEDIFWVFNADIPEDFTGHSLSVSDIVEIEESNTIDPGRYYCDSVGWKRF